MNIVITGGAGFIGSHLAKFYLDRGDRVTVIDNLFSGRKENIAHLLSHPDFIFEEEDVCKFARLKEVLHSADRIYHMAAIVGQKLVLTHPVEVLSQNIRSTELVLEMVSQGKKDIKVLIASSSCVYDRLPSNLPKEETVDLVMASGRFAQETYPLSKLVNEVMSLSYGVSKNLHPIIIRLFNVIGPNQTGRYGMVVPSFIRQALTGEPMTVYGDGSQTRSFCYIDDVLHILHKLMEMPSCQGQIINVGSREEVSILSLAKLINKKTNSASPIIHIPYQEAYKMEFRDVERRSPVLDKLKSLIGTFPQTSLEKAIDFMIAAKI